MKELLPNLTQRQEDLLRPANVLNSNYQKNWTVIPGVWEFEDIVLDFYGK